MLDPNPTLSGAESTTLEVMVPSDGRMTGPEDAEMFDLKVFLCN